MDVASVPGLPSTQGGCISAAVGLPSSTHGGCIANVALPSSTQVGYIAASPMLVKSSSFTGKCNAEQAAAAELIDQTDILTIDDLLDFSNEDIGGPIEAASCHELIQIEHPPSVLPALDRKLLHPCGGGNGNCLDSADSLCMPCDDLAELEWLSNFVEESFSSADAPPCLGWGTYGSLGNDDDDKATGHHRNSADSFRTTSPISVLESNNSFSRGKHCLPFSLSPEMSPVPGRARSKRRRTAVCFWNTRILSPQLSESLLETPSTTYAIQAASSESNMYNAYYDYDDDDDDDEEEDVQGRPQVCGNSSDFVRIHSNQRVKNLSLKGKNSSFKKPKSSMKLFNPKPKKIKLEDTSMVRKCLHCATQKTPQWRAGPMGPKTLCNACGVRYKSGRLCDEYRPAASPTFVETVHSNSHRKVLEMRRQRGEMSGGGHHENHKHGKENNTHRLWWGDSGTCDSAGKTTDGNTYATTLDEKEVDRSE